MIGPFAVRPADLEGLGDDEAVDLVRHLIWADAAASGIGGGGINVPAPQDVRDGGIDAEVLHSAADGRYGVIKRGNTRYQVKSGRFSPSEAGIKKILLNDSGDVKGRIKSCLDKGGALVVAFTKWDDPDQTDEAAAGRFRDVLAGVSPEYGAARIEVWRQNTIMGFLDHFPAIRLHLIGAPQGGHYSLDEWAGLSDMGKRAHLGASQEKFIADLRGHLRDDSRAMHVRITGEPGMGKTRLALEACSADDLGGLVVYVDSPRSLEREGIVHWLTRRSVDARAILVVDECDYESVAYYWNMIERHSPRIKMVTIYNEPGGDGRTTESMTVPPLSDAEVGGILSEYGIKGAALPRWIKLCRPYPRAAHMIGQSLAADYGDPLRPADTVDGWNRFIASRLAIGGPEHRTRRAVLLWLGIFKRFGYGGVGGGGEGRTIQELVSRYEGVSPGDFHRTVSKLREMKILQGSQTLYITPKILHVYLWSQWWAAYGDADLTEMLGVLDRAADADGGYGLRGWFYDMFAYAGGLIDAEGAAVRLLGAGGFLGGGGPSGAGHGASALLALSRAAPSAVLGHLEGEVADAGPGGDAAQSGDGRRGIVWALDYIAKRTGHAARAARILVPLAEAENEPGISNNATGVLHDIFVPDSTSLSPADQLELLESINASPDAGRKRLAIGGCKRALDPGATAPYFDTDGQPPQPRAEVPAASAARAEVVRYRRGALDILGAHIAEGGPLADAAADAVLDLALPLLREPELSGKVAGLLEAIRRGGRRTERLIAAVEGAVDGCGGEGGAVDAAVMDRLESMLEGAEGDDIHSRLKRYVGRDGRGAGNRGGQDGREAQLRDLAGIALRGGTLAGELPWLVTGEAEAGHRFGYALAVQDRGYTMLAAILEAVRSAGARANGLLVGGYLAHMCKSDPERWALVLDSIYDDPKARAVLPELVTISGITDASMSRIARGVSFGAFPCDALDLLKYPNSVSGGTLVECIEMLLGRPDRGAALVAMRLVYHHFARGGNHLQRELAEAVLLHPNVVGPGAGADCAPMDPWMWRGAALGLLERFPDRLLPVAAALVEGFGDSDFLRRDGSTPLDVLEGAARADPERVWGILSGRIGPPLDRRNRWLGSWLRGRLSGRAGSIMSAFPMGVVTGWVAERPGERAAHLARLLPDDFGVMRPFLSEYGDRGDVREALAENLLGGDRQGPGAGRCRVRGERYAELRGGEKDARVASWLDDILERIDRHVDQAAEEEMRSS